MKIIFILSIAVIVAAVLCMPVEATQPGAAQSRPNVSGGYDFYDASGAKTGSSSKRHDGGYDYFDQYGSRTGSIIEHEDTGAYEYRDAENIDRGSLKADPYGGYRFKAKGEDVVTAGQTNIRRSYGYADTYGSGIETLSSDVIRGIDSTSQPATDTTGLETSSQANTGSGLSTITSAD